MKYILALLALSVSTTVFADTYVKGYTKKDGTYVQGHTRSNSDSYRYNNRGSQTNGGSQRDEYSNGSGATNRSNNGWSSYDNDNDGINNSYDLTPEKR